MAAYSFNGQGGIEIDFNGIVPSDEIRQKMKSVRYSWNPTKKTWCASISEGAIAMAKEICGEGKTEYSGNAVYDYIKEKEFDYFYCVENEWILVYGNSHSIPKLIVYVSKVDKITSPLSARENVAISKSYNIAHDLKLPFLCVRFMANSSSVLMWKPGDPSWTPMTYDQLRDQL